MALIPVSKAAKLVDTSVTTLYRQITAGDLECIQQGKRKMLRDTDVLRLYSKLPPVTSTKRKARVYGIANQKGGVGKTTTTANLAAALAGNGDQVLVIDCDPQASLTQSLGVRADDHTKQTLFNVLVDRVPLSSVLINPLPTLPSLTLCPANIQLATTERRMGGISREGKLRQVLAQHLDEYDYILLDCPPALGLLTLAALAAATEIIVPVDVGIFSLFGVSQLQESIEEVREFNPDLGNVYALSNRVDKTVLSQDVRAELEMAFGDHLLKTVIRKSVTVGYAQAAYQPVTLYRPKDPASSDYLALADEIRALGGS